MNEEDNEKAKRLWESESFLGVTDSGSEERLTAYLSSNKVLSFVAYDGNRLVGAAFAEHRLRKSFINHLCVNEGYRRMGVATKLVELCEKALADELPLRSNVMVFRDNKKAVEFWENMSTRLIRVLI